MLLAFFNDPDIVNRILVGVLLFALTTAASFVIGRYWGRYLAARQWQRKQFLGRIIVSLNCLVGGVLRIRTIFERSLEEVFLNPLAVEKIQEAAKRTTDENAILPIPSEDRWFLLNFVLNAVAEKFSEGAMRFDATQSGTPVTYLLFLTSETVGEDRIRKVRAMLIRKELLEKFPYEESMPQLENSWHGDRIVTLRQASRRYRQQPDDFLPLEIYV